MPLDIQAHLLRVLEERSFFPVGGTAPVRVDVRLISASNKALRREVAAGRFRDDLRYRIRVVPIFLPPLRQRRGDIEGLLWHFIAQFNAEGLRRIEGVRGEAMEAILACPWPGNVRELRNVVQHAFVVGDGPILEREDLTPELRGEPPRGGEAEQSLRQIERQRLLDTLRATRGRKQAAARQLGMSRATLWRKLKEHQLT
jgi:DNA-binding NtrC family response regulator